MIFFFIITWLSEVYLTSLVALFWNFPLLFSQSKIIRMSISTTFRKMFKAKVGNKNMSFTTLNFLSHNNYCSVGAMEFCLLNLLILIDWFLRNFYHCVYSLRACHMWLTRNHMFIREICGKFTSFIFWNFQIYNLIIP